MDLERVMLVEDDDDVRKVATLALEHVGGLGVHACSSGAAALESVPRFLPQLVVLDVMMPNMPGPEVFAALRKLPEMESIPIVFMTAKARSEEAKSLLDLGADAVIAKPFDPMTLADRLREIWLASTESG